LPSESMISESARSMLRTATDLNMVQFRLFLRLDEAVTICDRLCL
jgi:hypothetical protein